MIQHDTYDISKMGSAPKRRVDSFKRYMRDYYQLYILLLPAVAFIFIFCYIPMYGAQIAFRDFKIQHGYWGSQWVGLKHFHRFVTGHNFWPLLRNTIGLNLYALIAGFPFPIILAIMLNEVHLIKFKKTVQMITYAPYFISTVAIGGLITLFLKRETGLINLVRIALGFEGYDFLTDPKWFKTIYVVSGIWQGVGWGAIIYIAALTAVDKQIIEAARIDGASRIQKIWYIDIPTILPTIVIQLVLSAGSIMNVGFEKILLLQNSLNMEASDVIATYVYRLGILDAQYSYTSAIGLFNSFINILLLIIVNKVAGSLTDTALW